MKVRRIVTLLAVALVLGTMLALSATAEIVGGNGKFVNDDGTDVDYANANVSFAPWDIKDGEATPTLDEKVYTDLTEGTNTNLAGLYFVKEGDSAERVVHVTTSDSSARSAITKDNPGYDNWLSGSRWVTGKLVGIGNNQEIGKTSTTFACSQANHYGKVSGYSTIFFGYNYTDAFDPALYIKRDEDKDDSTSNNGVTRAKYGEAVELYSYKYALKNTEIIPASDFISFKYGVLRSGSIDVKQTKTKLQILVYDINDGFKTYEAIDDALTATTQNTESVHVINASDAMLVGGTQTLKDAPKTSYIVGYEIFPCVDPDSTKFTIADYVYEEGYTGTQGTQLGTKTIGGSSFAYYHANNEFDVAIYYVDYSIVTPALPETLGESEGKITGLDFENYEYQYTPVTMRKGNSWSSYNVNNTSYVENPAAPSIDAWDDFTSEMNTGLAGLYKVREKGNDYLARLVYVHGPVSERQSVARYAKGINNGIGNDWHVGVFSTIGYNQANTYDEGNKHFTVNETVGSIRSSSDSHLGILYKNEFRYINFISTYEAENQLNPALFIQYEEDDNSNTNGYGVTRELYARAVQEYSAKYALKANEILPASEFRSFTYGIDRTKGGSINIGSTGTKLRVAVYDADYNRVMMFDGIDDFATSTDGSLTKHTVTFDDLTCDSVKLSDYAKSSNSYILGYEIFPVADFGDDKVEASDVVLTGNINAANQFYVTIYYGEYEFSDGDRLPENIEFDIFSNKLSGLTGNYTYCVAPYDATGVDYDNAVEINVTNDTATIDDSISGLLAVYVKGNTYLADSDPFVFFIPSENAGRFDCRAGSAISAVYTNSDIYFGTAGTWTYDGYSTVVGTNNGGALGYTAPGFLAGNGFHYHLGGAAYEKITTEAGTVYKEINYDYENRMQDMEFHYTFKGSQVFDLRQVKKFYIPSVTYIQHPTGSANILVEVDDPENLPTDVKTTTDSTTGETIYYKTVKAGVNNGASFETVITLYYYDTADGEIKSIDMSSGKVSAATATALTFTMPEDKRNCEGYVLGFAIKPFQNIDRNGHKTLFGQYVNTGARAYWQIIETAEGEAYNSFTRQFDLYDEFICSEFPYNVKLEDGTFATVDGDTNYYQYAPVTFAGGDNLSATIGEYNATPFRLSDATNKVTNSGLYVLRMTNEDASILSTASNIVYFTDSTDAEKQYLGNITKTEAYVAPAPQTPWQQGYWRDSVNYINGLNVGTSYNLTNGGAQIPCMNMAQEGTPSTSETLYKNVDADAVKAAQETVMSQVNALSLKYAYTDAEIIPASDFVSFTYNVGLRQGNIRLAKETDSKNKNTKIVFYVANPDKTVTAYEKYITEPTMKIGSSVGSSNNIVVKASDLINDGKAINTSEGYIVGVEIYPTIITDSTEIYALEASYDPDENKETPQYYVNGSFNVNIICSGYTFVASPDAPAVEMVEGDILTVTDYNALYDYQYKEGDGDWTELQAKSIRVTSPATEYSVRILEGDYTHASKNVATVTSHDFIENGTSLILGGEIGIKTLFEVAEGKTLDVKCYDKDGTEITPVMSADGKSIIIYVPAKDRADGFKYSYTYNDDTVERNILTVADYISFAKSEYASNENALTLVNAIDSYTTQADIYFDEEATIVNYGDVATIQNATDIPDASYTPNDSNFEYRGAALILEGKTAIRHYFALADESSEGYVATVDDKELDIQKDTDNGVYYVDIADIGAKDIGKSFTLTITNNNAAENNTTTITYGVINYLKNQNKPDTKLGNLVRAMYDYHKAAIAFDAN